MERKPGDPSWGVIGNLKKILRKLKLFEVYSKWNLIKPSEKRAFDWVGKQQKWNHVQLNWVALFPHRLVFIYILLPN